MFDHIGKAITAFMIFVGLAGCVVTMAGAKAYSMYAEHRAGITLDTIIDERKVCETKLPRNQQCKPEVTFIIVTLE